MSPTLELKLMTILFKLQDYSLKDIEIDEKKNRIIIDLAEATAKKRADCLYPHIRYDSTVQLILIGMSFGRPVYGRIKVYRTQCKYCGVQTDPQTISEGKRRYSKALGPEILKYTALMDNNSVSKLLGIPSRTIYRIDYNSLSALMPEYEKRLRMPLAISVDEIAYKKGHNYATVITDYHSSQVLWLTKNRKFVDLKRAYDKFGSSKKECKIVAMDFWQAYEKATKKYLSKAKIVYDRFHLARILNRKIEEERRIYQNSLDEDDKKKIKRNFRWLILKRKNKMDQGNLLDLEKMKADNLPLYNIYLLKESFLNIFNQDTTRKEALTEITEWTNTVLKTDYKKLKQFARSILKRVDRILNWFDQPISNAKSEGLNNVIRTLLKRAYGYKNFDYFRMKVLQKKGMLMQFSMENLNG